MAFRKMRPVIESTVYAQDILGVTHAQPRYAICTLVNNPGYYRDMLASFRAKGFNEANSAFYFLDTVNNKGWDAYSGLNVFLNRVDGDYVILCHQDVRPIDDEEVLHRRLVELNSLDPQWALAGNAGNTSAGKLRIRISDGGGDDRRKGPLPDQVVSLDENFIVVRGTVNLGLSADVHGYHFYGSDLVTLANTAGWSAYVIDYHLLHFGLGITGEPFRCNMKRFENKYRRAFQGRYIRTTILRVKLGRVPLTQRGLREFRTFWSGTVLQALRILRRSLFSASNSSIARGNIKLDK
jgi:hypothetical protein